MTSALRRLPAALAALLYISVAPALAATPAAKNPYAGAWQFEYSGGDAGGGRVSVDEKGAVTGSGRSTEAGIDFVVAGHITPSGDMVMTATTSGEASTGATFTGRAVNDKGSGTWDNADVGVSGPWTARRVGTAPAVVSRGVSCTVGDLSFDVPAATADLVMVPGATEYLWRLIAWSPVELPEESRAGIELHLAGQLRAGQWSLAPAAHQRSRSMLRGKDHAVQSGSVVFTLLEPAAGGPPPSSGADGLSVGTASGTADFVSKDGVRGTCRFSVPLQVIDQGKFKPAG